VPGIDRFKDKFIGLQVNLLRKIQENDSIHKPTSMEKRKILLDAIEDLADLDPEFRYQLRQCSRFWRPTESHKGVFWETEVVHGLLQSQDDFAELNQVNNDLERRIESLQKYIKTTDIETERLQNEIHLMKDRFFRTGTISAGERRIQAQLTQLKEQYTKIFAKEENEIDRDTEDRRMKKELIEKIRLQKADLRLMKLITRRMQYFEGEESATG
jgi:hypothetical protein